VKYPDALRKLHAAILGMIATLQAYPYAVEPWMPALIERLSRHATDPQPVAPAIRKFAAEFKKTHQARETTPSYILNLINAFYRTRGISTRNYLMRTNYKRCKLSSQARVTVSGL